MMFPHLCLLLAQQQLLFHLMQQLLIAPEHLSMFKQVIPVLHQLVLRRSSKRQ
jgi:hypothetical protein